jgi:hypothetical protein
MRQLGLYASVLVVTMDAAQAAPPWSEYGVAVPLRRVSCDLRFFPLCGFLPSEVHLLDDKPAEFLRRRKNEVEGPTLLAPLLEQLAFLGENVPVATPPPNSPLNWSNYLVELMQGRGDTALPHLSRFINTDLLEDPETVFTQKFHNRQLHQDRLRVVRERVFGH